MSVFFSTPASRARTQYAGVVYRRFSDASAPLPNELTNEALVRQRFEEHGTEMGPLPRYLESTGGLVEIAAVDDSDRSYEIVRRLMTHRRGLEVLRKKGSKISSWEFRKRPRGRQVRG